RINTQGIDRSIRLMGDSLLEWDENAGAWITLYMLDPTSTIRPYRMPGGYLTGYIFICHPVLGILYMSVSTGAVGKLQVPGLPARPLACNVNNGRLCVVDQESLYWSAQSNGFDFIPSLGGAGSQKVNDRVPGKPIMI